MTFCKPESNTGMFFERAASTFDTKRRSSKTWRRKATITPARICAAGPDDVANTCWHSLASWHRAASWSRALKPSRRVKVVFKRSARS